MNKKSKQYIFSMATAALLIALKIVLERFLSYSVWNQRFGFSFIAVAFAAAMLGTPWAMLVAGAGDVLGMLIFPNGPYFPGFTLTAVLTALCTGLFIHKNASFLRVTLSVLINQIFGSVLLNSLWIFSLTHSSSRICWFSFHILISFVNCPTFLPLLVSSFIQSRYLGWFQT